MEERERTKRQRKKTNVRRRRGTWISRPFGRFADPLASDSSDSDYVPSEDIIPAGKSSGKRKKPFERFSHPAKDESISRRKKVKHGDSCTYVKQILDDAKSERPSLGSFHSSALEQNDSSTAKNFAVWNTIPTEIIVKIFRLVVQESNGIKLLLRSGSTCKQWYYSSKHPSLWETVDLSFMSNSTRANDKTVTSLLKKQGENVRSLILNNWTKLTKKGMMVISTMCPNLETLSISGCEYSTRNDKGISADSIISVIEKCNLKIIDFSWFKLPSGNRIISSLMEKRGKDLISLNLCGCTVYSNILNNIMDSCKNLQILDISNTLINTVNIEKLQICCPKLQELYIARSNLTIKSSSHRPQDEVPCFKDLAALSLQCDCLIDEILAQAVRGCHKLTLLDLRTCRFITLLQIMNIETTVLERLFLSHACASFSLREILGKWGASLHELDLSWIAPGTNSHGLDDINLAEISASGMKFSAMKRLDLAGTAVCDEGVRLLLGLFPNLESLNLTSCKGVSRGLKHEHDRCGIRELRKKMKVKK